MAISDPNQPVSATSQKAPQSLGKETKSSLAASRRMPWWILLCKYFSIFLFLANVLIFLWLKADMNMDNQILAPFGLQENTGQRYERYSQQKESLEKKERKLIREKSILNKKIKQEDYTRHSETIKTLQADQFQWFDEMNDEGELVFGILDAPRRIQHYFNSLSYRNTYLSGNEISVSNVSATRHKLSFGSKLSNIYGQVFYLNVEFLDIMNAHPRLKNGLVRNFSRQKDSDETDSTTLSLSFDIQGLEEVDPDDRRFQDYKNWFDKILAQ